MHIGLNHFNNNNYNNNLKLNYFNNNNLHNKVVNFFIKN